VRQAGSRNTNPTLAGGFSSRKEASMRKFFAAACCVIVVLQLLIAVPLVVCVVFFAYASADMNVQAQVSGPTYYPPTPVGYATPATPCDSGACLATLPAPIPQSQLAYPSPPEHTKAPAAMLPAPSADPWLPQPVQAPTQDVAPSPAQVAAIAEVRESLGSPIDDAFGSEAKEPPTSPLAPPTETAPSLSVPAPGNPLVADVPAVGPPADATISEKSDAGSCKIDPIDTLLASLRTSADHLYTLSQSLEADGNYGRADQLRKLARDIREEVGMIGREHKTTSPPPSPATVTAASFDPAVLPASHEVPVPPAVAPTFEGARRIPIVEEEEEKLGIELP
jgi:hypothetical protein